MERETGLDAPSACVSPGTACTNLLVTSASLNGMALSALGLEDLGTGSDVSHDGSLEGIGETLCNK